MIASPVIAADLKAIGLSDCDPLFSVVIEEVKQWTIEEQWEFVLKQLSEEVSTLEKALNEGRAISSIISFSKRKPQLKLIIFIQALSRTHGTKAKPHLSVDDVSLLNELVIWREPRWQLQLPQAQASFLRGVLKERSVRQYFTSLNDLGCLPFLCELITDYSSIALVLKEQVISKDGQVKCFSSFLREKHPSLPQDYIDALFQDPPKLCLRAVIAFAAHGEKQSSFLLEHIDRFQSQNEQEAAKAIELLHDLSRLTSFESISSYIARLPPYPKARLTEFLSVISELPVSDDPRVGKASFSNDYMSWANDFHSAVSNVIGHVFRTPYEKYLNLIKVMNWRLQLDRYEDFAEEFSAILDEAKAHSFKENSYHMLLMQILF